MAKLPESNKPYANHLIDFDPPLYNIWKQQEKSVGAKHPGNSEVRWRTRVRGWPPTNVRASRRLHAGVGSRALGHATCGVWAPERTGPWAEVGQVA